jgi:hypothetical protein
MGMNDQEKLVRELELALRAAQVAKAKGLLGDGADEVIKKAEEALEKAKIYDFNTGRKLADLPTEETPSNRAVFPARDDKPARIEPDARGKVNIEQSQKRQPLTNKGMLRHPEDAELPHKTHEERLGHAMATHGDVFDYKGDLGSRLRGGTRHWKAKDHLKVGLDSLVRARLRPEAELADRDLAEAYEHLHLAREKDAKSQKVREVLKSDLAKAKIDEGLSDDAKQEARWKRNKPFMPGSMKRRLQTGVHHPLQYHGNDKAMAGQSDTSLFSNPETKKRRVREITEESKKIQPKLPKSEVQKDEPLSKPYSSEAQRRWAHTEKGKKALGGAEKVREWDKESKGKKLPERVAKSQLPHHSEHQALQHVDEYGELPKGVDPKPHVEAGHIQQDPRHSNRFALTDKGGDRLRAIREERRAMAKAKIDEGKPLDAKVSDRNSRGEQMERGVHPPLKYGGKGMKGTSIAGGYLEEGSKGDVKRWHNKVSDELRSMKSPKLPKSELIKEELRKPFQPRYKKD